MKSIYFRSFAQTRNRHTTDACIRNHLRFRIYMKYTHTFNSHLFLYQIIVYYSTLYRCRKSIPISISKRSSIFQNHLLAYFTTQVPTYMEVVRPSLWASSRGFMKFSRLNAGIIYQWWRNVTNARCFWFIFYICVWCTSVFVVQITIMYAFIY